MLLFFLFFTILSSLYIGYKLLWKPYIFFKKSFRFIFPQVEKSTQKRKMQGHFSYYQSLNLSLAGTIGIGNISGVVIALGLAGPSAIFWIWVSAFLGMSLKFASVFITLKYRKIEKNNYISGGSMFIYRDYLKMPYLGHIISIVTLFTALYIGNFIQSEAILKGFQFVIPEIESWDIYMIAFFLSLTVAFVIFDGVLTIVHMTSILVPLMVIFYTFSCLWIIFIHIDEIPSLFYLIFNSIFSFESISVGFLSFFFFPGFQEGILRGFFSNESALGSSSMAHMMVKTDKISKQSLVAMFEPIIDSLFICSLTAFVLILTDSWNLFRDLQNPFNIMVHAFQKGFSIFFNDEALFFSSLIVGLSIVFFAYTTIITWAYYGEQCIVYFFGSQQKIFFFLYRLLYVFITFLGSFFTLSPLNNIFYYMSFLISFPHLILLIFLIKEIKEESFLYFKTFNKRS